MKPIKISVVLVDRANYGRLKPVLEIMRDDSDIELNLVCTGTMLLDRFGRSVDLVKQDGFSIAEEVYIELEGSVSSTMAKSIGLAIIELSNVFQKYSPDFVLIIGDRSEALGVAIAAVYQNFCLIHIQGGEVTGSIDESARHAITKLAHYHFPSTNKSAENIIQMGESKKCVFPYGCPSADVVFQSRHKVGNLSLSKGVGPSLDLSLDYLLILFHPVTTECIDAESQMKEILDTVQEIGMQTVIIWPNIDAGADGVSQAIRIFRESNPKFMLHAFKNFEPELEITSAISKVVLGETALQSTKTGELSEPSINLATFLAKFSASSGGIIEKIKSDTETTSLRFPRSSIFDRFALVFVNLLRPSNTVTTL